VDSERTTLHRYYIWANKFRTHFDRIASSPAATDPNSPIWFASESGLFLSYWYAALYVVVEGWQESKFHDPEIDSLLTSPNVKHLKRFRHGVCHFQPKYLDERFLEIARSPASAEWVRALNVAFGRFFLEP